MARFYFLLLIILVDRLVSFWWNKEQIVYHSGETVDITATLDGEPRPQGALQAFKANNYQILASSNLPVHFGDRIRIKGKVSCPQKAVACSRPQISRPEIQLLAPGNLNFWWRGAQALRTRVLFNYQAVLTPSQANLLSGIVLGNLSLNRDFKNKLANAGLTHIVAASGMNVSLFSVGVFWLLSLFHIGRTARVILASGLILFYATLTGFEAPIVRAVLMAEFSFAGMLLGRQTGGFSGLLMAAYLMLWVSPDLIISPSFLLSFAAMMSQILLSTFEWEAPKNWRLIMEPALQNLAAILATFPIVLIFFSNFSLFSLISNLLVVWMVEPLMILGGLMATLGLIFTPISRACALSAQALLDFFLWVVDFANRANLFQIHLSFANNITAVLFAAGYYLLLAGLLLGRRSWSVRRA